MLTDFLGWGKSNFNSVFSGPLNTCKRSKMTRSTQTGVRFRLLKAIVVQMSFSLCFLLTSLVLSEGLSHSLNREQSWHKTHSFLYITLWKCIQEEAIYIGQPPKCYFWMKFNYCSMVTRQVSFGKTSRQYFCLCGTDWN